jgi:NitT/TauT family transport system ATP-binding protein
MQDELLGLWDKTRFTVMFVTHSIAEAIKIGNRVLLLSPHPGRVRAELNSAMNPDDVMHLEKEIHEMLFSESAPEAAHA